MSVLEWQYGRPYLAQIMPRKGGAKKKVGQAPALTRPAWDEWIKFVGQNCGARVAVILAILAFAAQRR